MGLHPSMGTLVPRVSGLALVPHPIGDGENRGLGRYQNTEVPDTASDGCTKVQPMRRDAWDNLPLCSYRKGTPAVLGRTW